MDKEQITAIFNSAPVEVPCGKCWAMRHPHKATVYLGCSQDLLGEGTDSLHRVGLPQRDGGVGTCAS